MRATLVVPTLNERASIGHVLSSFKSATEAANASLFSKDPIEWEVLVIDGASTDGTGEIARAAGATVVNEPRKGYGRAYRTGFERATGEVVATLDGDGTYPTEDVPRFVRRLFDEHLDFITGDRLTRLDSRAMTTEHRVGNWVLNTFVRVAYAKYVRLAAGERLVDSQSGMWVFRRAILSKLDLSQDGMPFSEELKIEVLLRGFRLEETPITYSERWGAPKLSSWRDGYKNLAFLFRKRLLVAQETKRRRAIGIAADAREPAPR